IASCLIENGIEVESSVFKGGRRDGAARFDYRDAQSEILPWRADRDNICHEDRSSPLWEFPIYCEMRPVWSFINVNRVYWMALSRVRRLSDARSCQARHSESRLGQLA